MIDANSIQACRILADATEKENEPETVAWRAQIARLDPGLDSQLNLASAALRFGQLDMARDALARVSPADQDKAAYHVVAGWLSRAQGNVAEEERHFAAAVATNLATTFTSLTSLPCRSFRRIRRRMRRRAISSSV